MQGPELVIVASKLAKISAAQHEVLPISFYVLCAVNLPSRITLNRLCPESEPTPNGVFRIS